jgi:hypothetical protein
VRSGDDRRVVMNEREEERKCKQKGEEKGIEKDN